MKQTILEMSCLLVASAGALLLTSACTPTTPNESTAGDTATQTSPGAVDESRETLLVTGGRVVTMDPELGILEDGAVAVQNDRIVAVGPSGELTATYPDARRLSAEGGVVLPGLVNVHTHVPMTLFRGMADDLPLMRWLQEVIFPAEAKHVDEGLVRAGTRLACLEMILGGTTTFVDMYYYEDAIAEEAARCGLRAVVGETLIDFPAPDNKTWDEAMAYTEAFLKKWKGHPLITPAVAPHAVYTVSAEHLAATHELATRYDVPYLIHISEHPSEMRDVQERYGTTPLNYLDRLGLLDDRVVAAHVVLPTDAEIQRLAVQGVGASHCPQSNMKLGAGVSPVTRLLDAGVAVGLGTDGPASNNDLNMWEEIDTAAKLHKLHLSDPTAIDARTALRLATLGGAEVLDMEDQIGSLTVGKKADLIVVSLEGVHQQPVYDVESVLTYATKASDVRSMVVDGKILLENGELKTIDKNDVMDEIRPYRDAILETVKAVKPNL